MKGTARSGAFTGTGATVNVELGWIPNSVELFNSTDGTIATIAYLIPLVVAFTSGGTATISSGSTIRGATSGATATVADVQIASGTFAAGTAAGNLTLVEGTLTGTFGSENIVVTNLASGTIGTDDATVTAPTVTCYSNNSAAVATASGTSAISRYEGATASTGKGFTVGSVAATAGKLFRWRALRDDA
jgi:mannitol-specific phosphotransferase system IIBC component